MALDGLVEVRARIAELQGLTGARSSATPTSATSGDPGFASMLASAIGSDDGSSADPSALDPSGLDPSGLDPSALGLSGARLSAGGTSDATLGGLLANP